MEAELTWVDGLEPAELREAIEALPDELADQLESAAEDIGTRIRGAAQENAPVDENRLRSSLESLVEKVGNTIVRVRVGTNVEYAEPLEEGTDPFFPPPSELRGWAGRVLGDEDLAYPVARSISETGIEEHRYLRDALQDNIEWALTRVAEAVQSAFEEVGLA